MIKSIEEFNQKYYTKPDGSIFYRATKSYVGCQENFRLIIELSNLKKNLL